MKKIEVLVESVLVKKNGNRRNRHQSPEDLVLIAQWDDPNFAQESISGALDLDDVCNNQHWTRDTHSRAENDELKRLSTRLFKTTIDGESIIRFSLVRRKELSSFGTIFAKLINAAAIFGIGTVTSGIGAVLAKSAVRQIVSVPEKWSDTLGESTYFISDEGISDDKDEEIELMLSPKAKAALEKIYATAEYDRRTRRNGPLVLPDDVSEVIRSERNGSIKFKIRVL